MEHLILIFITIISIWNHTVLVVGMPTAENPILGNLFKLNSNATSKLRNIYTNYGIPGTLIKGNERDRSAQQNIDTRNFNKNYKNQFPDENAREGVPTLERSSYKPYVYEIEAVLFENDTNREKPVTYVYDMDQEIMNNWRSHNKSFILNENLLKNADTMMNEGILNDTAANDEFLSINYTIRIDKNILQILSQVLTDFVQKIFKKTLMSYITQNMNQTMSSVHDRKPKVKTFFNYAIDLKTDPISGGFPFTISNNNHNTNKNTNDDSVLNNNMTKATIPTFKPKKIDFQNLLEKLMSSNNGGQNFGRHVMTDNQSKGRENGFLIPYDDFDYDSNSPNRYQSTK